MLTKAKTKKPAKGRLSFRLNHLLASDLVRMEGLEPPRLAAPEPKSGVSANFTTSASRELESSAFEAEPLYHSVF